MTTKRQIKLAMLQLLQRRAGGVTDELYIQDTNDSYVGEYCLVVRGLGNNRALWVLWLEADDTLLVWNSKLANRHLPLTAKVVQVFKAMSGSDPEENDHLEDPPPALGPLGTALLRQTLIAELETTTVVEQ